METSLIEKFDKARYNLIKWITIGWIAWYGTFILKDLINNSVILGLMVVVGLAGWILFMVNLINLIRLGKKINVDLKLKEALSNEMYQFYLLKSTAWGFSIVMATVCALIGVTAFYQLSSLIAFEFILLAGVSSFLTANLIYNKR